MFGNKFDLYKSRFTKKEKLVRKELDNLSGCIEMHRANISKGKDIELDKTSLEKYASKIQTLVDELDDCMNHMNKIANSRQHKATILRFK